MLHDEGRQRERTALPFDRAAFAGLDRMMVEDRRIVAARRRHEAIGKPLHDVLGGRLVEIDRNAPALMHHDRAEIVDAVGLVGVLMGQEHRVEMVDIGVDQLLAQIGRGVDHDPRHAAIGSPLGQQRAAAAAVLRIIGIAGAPAERGTGNAGRGSAAENGEASASCRGFRRRHLGEQAEEILRGLARNLLERDAARLRQHLGDFDDISRLVALAAEFAAAPDTARRSPP